MSISLVYSLGFRATVSAARCLVVLPLLRLLLALPVLHVGEINDDDDDDVRTVAGNMFVKFEVRSFNPFGAISI